MKKKALIHERTEDNGTRIFIFLGYSTEDNGFFVEYGTRKGDAYDPEILTTQEFVARANEDEVAALYEFLNMMLSQ
ncbi:MAG: hypothetical protein AAFQ85_01230 [Pseudomonadota bacterium]